MGGWRLELVQPARKFAAPGVGDGEDATIGAVMLNFDRAGRPSLLLQTIQLAIDLWQHRAPKVGDGAVERLRLQVITGHRHSAEDAQDGVRQ